MKANWWSCSRPRRSRCFLDERHYLPFGVPLVKHVLALPGQTVCRTARVITVDGAAMGEALERDRFGRALPAWQGCRVLGTGEVFLDEPHAAGLPRWAGFRAAADDRHRRPSRSDLDLRGELTMPPSSTDRQSPRRSSGPCAPSSFPAIAAPLARRTGSRRLHGICTSRVIRDRAGAAVRRAALLTRRPSDKRPPAVTSESGRFARFVSEAALRFGIPTSWITAVMQAESRGVVRAISPKGAMGLMQIMPDTWSGLRSRYGLGADPFDPHDNILAGAAYLRELHDRYGALGFLAAYNAGPGRYEDHLATGRPLPAETRAYVAALTPLLHDGGSAPGNFITAIIRSWTDAPLFPVRRSDGSTVPPAVIGWRVKTTIRLQASAADWTGLAPQSEGLFARLSIRRPRP